MLVAAISTAACGTDSGGGGGSCTNMAGNWTLTDHCEGDFIGDTLVLSQEGCSISSSGAFTGFTGTVGSSGSLTMTGTPDDDTLTCTGSVSGDSFTVDCTPGGCHVEGRRQGSSSTGEGGLVDDPCSSASECSLSNAVCQDVGDGVDRCEAGCTSNSACGSQGACLVPSGSETGVCYRTCSTPSDCASGSWICQPAVEGSSQGYCFLNTEG